MTSKILHVISSGGTIADIPLMCKIGTMPKAKCSWIWK